MQITVEGYDIREKTAKKGGNSARIYVPIEWKDKKVKVILMEEIDEK